MPSKSLPVVQVKPLLKGSPEYEAGRAAVLEEFAAKVPDNLRLPIDLINNPPKNVTGVPKECGLLTPEELAITEEYDATALAGLVASKKLTAVAITTAFSKRAIIAHQLTGCLTEWFMDDAVEQAKRLDEHLQSTGKTIGLLHGVPISVKEHLPLAGHYSSIGLYDARVKDEEDCHIVAALRDAGAVFYCKTNMPQGIMHLDTSSSWGRTLNPHNIRLSAGGSSGGEAALLAMRGSVLGIGSDIGGSVRNPAAFCGIYGFKPTSCVVPRKGLVAGGAIAELNILTTAGPLCNSLRDMDLFMSILAQHLERDQFRCDFARHWESQDVDFVICPVSFGPECEHEMSYYPNYTAFWNYVDYPCAVVPTPIRAGKKGVEGYAADGPAPLSKDDEHVRQMREEGDSEGAPVNLQIVARKYHDNDLFAALEKMQWVLELP
ncbi:hypothetical protein THARTR1_02930 [Trichoderma harzianum]|uniref:amidase n=1 Tax=Trichoderma harzianum TaxID=5544 RepID=A0A2K0UH33_TRIHA|nr:hypothetical protein THARTR1_02930 [Trichoderma harzianum]